MEGLIRRDDLEAVRGSDMFDAGWYAATYPDVALLGLDPAEHYLWLGRRLGRDPGPRFDAAAYLAVNDDVARAGLDPLLHYIRYGRAEGRWPLPVRQPALSRPVRGGTARRTEGAGGRRPTLNWVMNPDNAGWAYGNNAQALAAFMPGFDHVFDGFGQDTDAALFFDIRVFRMRGTRAARNVLRVGGPRPVELAFGHDRDRLAADLAAFDAVVVLNRALLAAIGPLHPDVRLVPNALDLDAWREAGAAAARDPERPFTVGFAGNLATAQERSLKGFDLVTAACASLGVEFLHLGKGEGQIPRSEMPARFYGAIDVLAHPVGPGKEGCSNVIMEALALGVPVVTTRDAGFHAELIEDGEGLLYCDRSLEGLAAAIDRLRGDPVLRDAMREGALRFARLHHDIRRTAPIYARLLTPADMAADGPVVEFLPFWSPPGRFASSRLRCAQPVALLEGSPVLRPRLGLGAPSPDADAVVVSQLASNETMAALSADPGRRVIYDLCDRYFDDDRTVGGVAAKSRFHETARRADVITTSTLALKREVAGLGLRKAVVHLPDGIDYRGARDPRPTDPGGPVIWFGNPGRGNFDSARWMIDHARRAGRAVRLISRRGHFAHLARTDPGLAAYADLCLEWEEEGFVEALRAGGLCVLATSADEPSKSPNRLVTAVMNGLPAIVSGSPASADLLRKAGLGWAVVADAARLAAAMARLADTDERLRYLARMQVLLEAEVGDDATRDRYEALVRDHVGPRRGPPPRARRVLFVSHNLGAGEGAPTSLLQTVLGLKDAHGIEPTVFAVIPGALAEAYAAGGVPVVVPDFGLQGRFATSILSQRSDPMADAFRDCVRAARPDLVVVNTATSLWFAALAEDMGLPTLSVIRESGAEHVGFAFGPPEVMRACEAGLRRTRRVVFVSDHTRRLWAGRHDLADPVLIPNGIDLSAFDAARAQGRAEARRAVGEPEGGLLLLSVGSINPRKSQIDIVDALALLPREAWGQVRLALVGARPGEYLDALAARVAALDPALAGRVRVVPETAAIGPWYRAADVFVFASRSESYPRVILEAMSFGLPIVSSAVFGTQEQVVDGESGLLFPPGDAPALAHHLGRLIADPPRRAALGRAAGERAWELVTYWEMVNRYAVVIDRILAESGRSRA